MHKWCGEPTLQIDELPKRFEAVWQSFGHSAAVYHVQSLVCCVLGMHRACGKFQLRIGCVCTAPSVCAMLLGIRIAPSKTSSNSLKRSQSHTHTFAMSLQGL